MDEQKNAQDLSVGVNGEMTQGINIEEPKNDEQPQDQAATDPEINEATPPPTEEVITEDAVSENNNTLDSTNFDTQQQGINSESTQDLGGVVQAPDDPAVTDNSVSEPGTESTGSQVTPSEESSVPVSAAPTGEIAPIMTSSHNSTKKNTHEHRNNRKLAVVVTIMVASILAAAAIYVYVAAQDNAEPAQTVIEEVSADNLQPATANDVDETVQGIDDTINGLDDTTDFSEEAISDTTLELN